MQTIDEYFKKIQEIIANSKIVASTNIEYTKVLDHEGYMQGTLTLIEGSELRLLEYTNISHGQPNILRYRFQWQTAGELTARWNNAPHHPEVETFPHHKHVKGEDKPKPSRVCRFTYSNRFSRGGVLNVVFSCYLLISPCL